MEYFTNRSGLQLAFNISIKYPDDKKIYIVCATHPSELFFLPEFIYENLDRNVFKFDLTGDGNSQGQCNIAGYRRDVDDIDDAVKFLISRGYSVEGIIGNSKYATSVIQYSAIYGDVKTIISLSPKYNLSNLPDFMQIYCETLQNGNEVIYIAFGRPWKFTREMMEELMNTNMKDYCENVKGYIYIIHGDADEFNPVSDAAEYTRELKEKCKGCYILNSDHYFTGVFDEVIEIIEKIISEN